MFQSTIIVDPKSEIKGKQSFNSYIVKPISLDRREAIRINQVQDMLTWCLKSAFVGTHKIVIIEELHKSSDAVPHALLKLLEEPPSNTQIAITIDRAESALATIRSRCAITLADELDLAMLELLGLQRISPATISAAISWPEFIAKSAEERIEWLASFVKSKKDSQTLLVSWQSEVVEHLSGNSANQVGLVKQLVLLEEVAAALRQNVLPRLALQYLHIKLKQLL